MAEKLIKEISEVNKMANDEQLQKKYNDEIVKKHGIIKRNLIFLQRRRRTLGNN